MGSPGLTGSEVAQQDPASSEIGETGAGTSAPPSVSVPERSRAAKKRFTLHSLVELVHDLAIAVIVCILLITYVIQAFKVQGSSMSPTLVNGERILVNKFVYNFNFSPIERGDIVVFWYPDDPNLSFIKRVVGLPGEIIEIRSGEVYVDGEPYPEAVYRRRQARLEESDPAGGPPGTLLRAGRQSGR